MLKLTWLALVIGGSCTATLALTDAEMEAATRASTVGKKSSADAGAKEYAAQFDVTGRPRAQKMDLGDRYWSLQIPCTDTARLSIEQSSPLAKFMKQYVYSNTKESIITIGAGVSGQPATLIPVFASVKDGSSFKQTTIKKTCAVSPYFTNATLGNNFVNVALKFTEVTNVSILDTLVKAGNLLAPLYTGPYGMVVTKLTSAGATKSAIDADTKLSDLFSGKDAASDTIVFNPEKHSAIDFVSVDGAVQRSSVLTIEVQTRDSLLTPDGTLEPLDKPMANSLGLLQIQRREVGGNAAGSLAVKPNATLSTAADFSTYCSDVFESLGKHGLNLYDSAVLTLAAMDARQWNSDVKFRDANDVSCETLLSSALSPTPKLAAYMRSYEDLDGLRNQKVDGIGKDNFDRIARLLQGGVAEASVSQYLTSTVLVINDSKSPVLEEQLGLKTGTSASMLNSDVNAVLVSASKGKWLTYKSNTGRCMNPSGKEMHVAYNSCFTVVAGDGAKVPVAIHVTLTGSRETTGVRIANIVFRDLSP